MPVTNYIYNPLTEALLMETDGDGNVTARYTQEPVKYGDIHAQHRIDPATGVGKSYYYHPDALGSTRELTDENGDVVATYNYDAFGNTIASTGTVENPFRFTGNVGYYWDEELQTYHILARNYQPTTGRWTSQDPIGFAGGINLYGAYFVPFETDPSGESPAVVGGALAGCAVSAGLSAATSWFSGDDFCTGCCKALVSCGFGAIGGAVGAALAQSGNPRLAACAWSAGQGAAAGFSKGLCGWVCGNGKNTDLTCGLISGLTNAVVGCLLGARTDATAKNAAEQMLAKAIMPVLLQITGHDINKTCKIFGS